MKSILSIIIVLLLWHSPDARNVSAKVLRVMADFLSPIEQPINQRNRR